MKKKLFLLPITLTALTPMISVVGCGDTPVDIEDYKVNEEDFEKIISMLGVQYLQSNGKEEQSTEGYSTTAEEVSSCSPTVYHTVQTTTNDGTSSYSEGYVYEQSNDPVYYKITRDNPKGHFSEPELVDKEQFITAENYGYGIFVDYILFLDHGGKLTFDSNDLWYKGEVHIPDTDYYISLKYQFFKNRLVKYKTQMDIVYNVTREQSFTYKKVTPDVPV